MPLDALPFEEAILGERITIRNEVTLARLLRPRREVSSGGGLFIVGGIDYDAELGRRVGDDLEELGYDQRPQVAGPVKSRRERVPFPGLIDTPVRRPRERHRR
ncbi:MAG: hypothetical protein HOP15_06130 [Planctomycetes bacterium]|nr:hypothetical protein [Planctomycetota bacterium]